MLHSAGVLEIMVDHIESNHKESAEMALKGAVYLSMDVKALMDAADAPVDGDF